MDEETLAIMKKAGCDAVSFGIESGNPEMLKRVRKRITLDQARQAVDACKRAGVMAHASFMVGLPGGKPADHAGFHKFWPGTGYFSWLPFSGPRFPGTTVREQIKDYDLEILTDDWGAV